MRIDVRFQSFAGVAKISEHFLVQERSLKVTAAVRGVKKALPVGDQVEGFTFDLLERKTSELELELELFLPHGGVRHRTLRIIQAFGVTPTAGGDFALLPKGWIFAPPTGVRRLHTVTNRPTPQLHPLLTIDASSRTVLVNALMVDITEFWLAVHGRAAQYTRWRDFVDPARVRLRVLAHLGGHPFVWFVVVPRHLLFQNLVSPHVFHLPADFGDIEYEGTTLAGLTSTAHQSAPPLWYLQAPIEDVQVAARTTPAGRYRGVYHVSQPTGEPPTLRHSEITAGLSKALADSGAQQVLFIPQRSTKAGHAHAVTRHVSNIVESALNVLWTNQEFLSQNFDRPLTVGKLVLSGFSDSGISLWSSAWTNADLVKGIIAVEPQWMASTKQGVDRSGVNKSGLDVIQKLFDDADKKQQPAPTVCIIGRYKATQYQLPLPAAHLARVAFFPSAADYDKTWVYPPAPAANNPWNTYRAHRLLYPTEDPLMRVEELAILQGLLVTGTTPARTLALIFPAAVNQDDTTGHFFSHLFAMTGGQELALPPRDSRNSYYGVPVTYKTFFQEALERIG
jgi:hypothetical protein